MVSPTGTPLTDVDKIFNELKSVLSEIKKIVGGVGENKETFSLKKSVNIGEISYKDWIKLIFDLYDEVSKEMGDEASDLISTKQDLLTQLDLTEEQLNEYATKLNDYSKIYNFYADADIKQNASELQSKMKLYASLGVTDFNAALGVFLPDNQFKEGPVKTVYAVFSYDYGTSMSDKGVNNKMQTETFYKIAVCTADKKGGIITFNSKASADLSDNDISNLNNNASIKISVEGNDGKKKSFEYTYDEFSGVIQSMF